MNRLNEFIRRLIIQLGHRGTAVACAVLIATAPAAAANIDGPYDVAVLTTVGPQIVRPFGATAQYFVGISSVGGPQTNTLTIYDNASACSGTLIFNGVPGNSQEIQKLWPGRAVANGITACMSGAVVGSIEIYAR